MKQILMILSITHLSYGKQPAITFFNSSLFIHQGNLIGDVSWGHLLITIDIAQQIQKHEQCKEQFEKLREFNHSIILHDIIDRKIQQTSNLLMEITEDFISQDSTKPRREKRQIAIGIAAVTGLIIGGVTGSLFSKSTSNALVDILEKRTNIITSQVEANFMTLHQINNTIQLVSQEL